MSAPTSSMDCDRISSPNFEQKKARFSEAVQKLNEPLSPISLPTNVAVRIFSFVSRDDLDNCMLVCKQWKWLVEYGGKALPKREIDVLVLSTCMEFSFLAGCRSVNSRGERYIFKKYFKERDIRGAEVHHSLNYRESRSFLQGLKCGCPLRSDVQPTMHFEHYDGFHQRFAKHHYQSTLYSSRFGNWYESKLFTPPLDYYERLSWLLKNCQVQKLVFWKFTFTDLFVAKFREYLPNPFIVKQLTMHCCKFKACSTTAFQQFVGETIVAEKYFLDNLRFMTPNHINLSLLKKPAIIRARIFFVGNCLSRHNTNLVFNVTDDDFLEVIRIISELKGDRTKRQFFGIEASRITNETIKEYKRLFQKHAAVAPATDRLNLYEHLLFGERRFLSKPLEDLVAVQQQQNNFHNVGLANNQNNNHHQNQGFDFMPNNNHAMVVDDESDVEDEDDDVQLGE